MDVNKVILTTSPLIYSAMRNRNIELLHDSNDDLDQEVNIILQRFVTVPRISVSNFFEEVVPAYSDEEFFRFFRLSRDIFNDLAKKYMDSPLYENIASQDLVTSAEKSVAIFLWFFGHECVSYRDISNLFNLSISTVHSIIRRIICFARIY